MIRQPAYAKLNLTLDVLNRRADGYHDLRSIMQTVSVRDDVELEIDTHEPWRIECDSRAVPTDETNLAWRAAEVYLRELDKTLDGLTIRITKRIPSQAGMAGGSADAAAVLRGLNDHFGQPLSLPALAELGAKVGSDVPFCVIGGTVLCEGRGERLTVLPPMTDSIYVICKPELHFSTPELYAALDGITIGERPNTTAMRAALQRGDLEQVGKGLCNVFEQVTIPTHPELNYIKSVLMTYGAYGAAMTGSGSAVFGIFDAFETAAVACMMLKENYPQVFIAQNTHTIV